MEVLPRISFCTTCMNRLHHLQSTFLKNIQDNIRYNNIEFVLLNYGSKDNLDDWVYKRLKSLITEGTVVYLKTEEPKYWNAAHAKNIAAIYSSGDVICNIDADSFAGSDFAMYVSMYFKRPGQFFLSGRIPAIPSDCMGRNCIRRKHYFDVRGYDERILGYGYEDQDIYSRLRASGIKEIEIDRVYLTTINHSNFDRVARTIFFDEVESILVSEASQQTGVLIFKKDFQYEHFVLTKFMDSARIDEDRSERGVWREHDKDVRMLSEINSRRSIKLEGVGPDCYFYGGSVYRKVSDSNIKNTNVLFHCQLLTNQRIYRENILNRNAIVNSAGFGLGEVQKNFR